MANELGRITVNNKEILSVDNDPSLAGGTPAEIASMALWDSGTVGRIYLKVGAADTAWTQIDTQIGDDWNLDGNDLTGATAATPNEFFGSTNDYDVIFRRNNFELMRLVSQGLLVGLNSSIGGRLQVGAANLGDQLFLETSPNGGAGARVIKVSRQFKIQTSDDTDQALASLEIPEGTRIQGEFRLGCNQHGGSAGTVGDGADYVRTFSAKRLAGNPAVLNDYQTDFTEEDVKAFRARIVENVNNIDLEVRGGANRDLAWSAHLEYMIFQD